MGKPIGTLGNVPSVGIPSNSFPIDQGSGTVRVLHCTIVAAAYSVLRNMDGSVYQVPASKVLDIYAMELQDNGTAAVCRLLYGSTSSGISGSAPSNPIYYGSGSSSSADMIQSIGTNQDKTLRKAIGFSVPAANYPTFQNSNAGANVFAVFFGIERAA
jgi:hypothetical protein